MERIIAAAQGGSSALNDWQSVIIAVAALAALCFLAWVTNRRPRP